MRRLSLFALVLAAAPAVAQTTDVPPDLLRYVTADDGAFKWTLADKAEVGGGVVYTLDLVSQKWQGIVWDHKLQVIVPKDAAPKATMLLWNQGGTPSTGSNLLAMEIAKRVGSPVAFLFGIPKQPLYDGKKEDALIAETFVKFLETKDPSWPLLFPMAKSLMKAMDALQAFAKQELKADVKQFVVTGASKRGWTSWLTAATGDPRVKAIAPMVIDTLNMPRQMAHQFESFGGKYSEQIRDYEARGLLPLPRTEDGKRLWQMVDPWTYRSKLTLPKLLIHGTNDPYWAQDATNLYWDDLRGPKYLCYVPNAGHDLRPMPDPANTRVKDPFPVQAINSLAAFARSQIDGTPFPKMQWQLHQAGNGNSEGWVLFCPGAKTVRFWSAEAPNRDFRKAKWTAETVRTGLPPGVTVETPGNVGPGYATSARPAPASGFRALLAEAEFESGGLTFSLTSQVHIVGPKK